MGILPGLKDLFLRQRPQHQQIRIHIDDALAVHLLSGELAAYLNDFPKKDQPVILCIGTDRSTGDSLGPLTGWHLSTLLQGTGIEILGTVDHPVHAQNLEQNLAAISKTAPHNPVIAIDACLGQQNSVGTIILERQPLKPGAGVCKVLPPVGDISISGVVNIGGFMELQVLQNTRLSTVLKMSQIIANSIYAALVKPSPP